jgi:N-formylglutamate amidohydrolase
LDTPRVSRRALLASASLAALGLAARDAAAAPGAVEVRRGDLPLLLTVPHDGGESIPGVPPRRNGVSVRDAETLPLARAVAHDVIVALGARPYFVAACFSRRHVDANRAPAQAYEVPAAASFYEAYHGAVREAVADLRARFPRGALLLDVHGQGVEPEALIRGTQDGTTVSALLERAGEAALSGPRSLFGQLQARGYPVRPANAPLSAAPETIYRGGFTVQAYGSHTADGVDAIQIEVGSRWRQPGETHRVAADLAAALVTFLNRFY